MTAVARLGVVGAGRVFERLYLPALQSTAGVELAAIVDPVVERTAITGGRIPRFATLEGLLEAPLVDAVIVLSPPASHSRIAIQAMERGLPVLVEKPLCYSLDELAQLRTAGAERLLTPALSRRYWPGYRRLAEAGPVRDLRIAIGVSPSAWGAYEGPADVAEDLFPHVADLARWLTASSITDIGGRRGARGVHVDMTMDNGARVSARMDVRDAYLEAVRADGRSMHVGPPSRLESMARRALRRDDPAVEAVGMMLQDWLAALRGVRAARLPTFEDGAATVAAMERLRSALVL